MNTGIYDIAPSFYDHYLDVIQGKVVLSNQAQEVRSELIALTGDATANVAEPTQKSIAIIPVRGPVQRNNILNTNNDVAVYGMDYVASRIRDCMNDVNNHALVLEIETGGGSSNSVAAVIDAIVQYKKVTGRKVYCSGDVVCSAGYHIAVFCDLIFANSRSAVFGCIGTKWEGTDSSEVDKKIGYKKISVTADSSPDKNKEFTDAMKGKPELLKTNLINPIGQHFLDDVLENRPGVDQKAVKGSTITAEAALKAGMIDGIMSLSDIVKSISTNSLPAKIDRATPNIISSSNLIPKNTTMEKFSFSGFIANVMNGSNTPEMNAQAIENASAFNAIKSEFDSYKLNSEAEIAQLKSELEDEKALRATDASTIADLNARLEKTTGTPPTQPADAGEQGEMVPQNTSFDPVMKSELDAFDRKVAQGLKQRGIN